MIISFFFFKQKTAYEMRISDWSSDVCSSDLIIVVGHDLGDAVDPAVGVDVADEKAVVPLQPARALLVSIAVDIEEHVHCVERPQLHAVAVKEIGRASCRERVGQYV